MIKIWYIDIEGRSEGPFSVDDLKRDHRITPDTLVWKAGFKFWKPIRDVPELKKVFADESEAKEPEQPKPKELKTPLPQNELVLDLKKEPPYLFWLLMIMAVAIYFVMQLFLKNDK